MTITWQEFQGNAPVIKTDDDELLIFFVDGRSPKPEITEVLLKQSYPNLSKTYEELKIGCGFLGPNGNRPWVVCEFSNPHRSVLEKRWLVEKLRKNVLLTNSRKIAIYLSSDNLAQSIALAEDFYFSGWDSFYHHCPWESFKILYPEGSIDGNRLDHHNLRRTGQLNYRQWVNANPDEMTSIALGEHLMDFSKEYGCGFMTLDEEDLKTHNLNLLAAVGQASRRSPSRLHVITHNYDPDKPVLLLIGKGVTFDTGGINLKPHESYVNCMKNDMAGAAMMTQLFMALVKAQVKQPLILAIPCCENLIDAQSMKPGSIITAHNGKKVIIEHTDAEGRLIIADTMSYCHQYFRPSQTLIAATLTTAALWQFSNFFTGVHFASPDFEKEILEHGHLWGEGFRFWPEFLPFAAGNKHPAADLTNMGHMPGQADKAAKSCVAAHFLRAFAKHPMVHFDIFASAWNWTGDYPGSHYGTTGAVINTLFELLLRRETKHDRNA